MNNANLFQVRSYMFSRFSFIILMSITQHMTKALASDLQTSNPFTIVSTHEGMVMSKSGLVTESSGSMTISFIVKLPTFVVHTPTTLCFTKSHNNSQVRIATEKFHQYINTLKEAHKDFLRSTGSILSPFMEKKSEKRSIFFAAITTLIGGALVGITEAQLHSIKSHVTRNTAVISDLYERVQELSSREIIFEKETIAFLKTFTERTKVALEFEHCLDELESFYTNAITSFSSYKTSIETLFEPQLKGVNFALLSSSFLAPHTLVGITSQHSSFHQQLYLERPTLLYNVAKISLISINHDLSLGHFVMVFPSIFSTTYFNLYSLQHTGVLLKENLCAQLNTPNTVYSKNGSLYAIDLGHCSSHFSFHLCPPEAFSVKPSCIQLHLSNCSVSKSACKTPYSAINIPKGILIRNNDPHSTFRRDFTDKTHSVHLSTLSTAFVPWLDTSHIQVGESLFTSPDNFDTVVDFKNYSTNFLFDPLLFTAADLVVAFSNYSNSYNVSLHDLLHNTHFNYIPHHSTALIILGVTTFLLCCIVSILTIKVFQIRCTLGKPHKPSQHRFEFTHSRTHNSQYDRASI